MTSSQVQPEISPKYVKFRIKGFDGVKHAVLLTEATAFDAKLVNKIFELLKLSPPNLLIEGVSSSNHTFFCQTKSELRTENFKKLMEGSEVAEESEDWETMARQCAMRKLQSVASAILAAAEQTKSYTFHGMLGVNNGSWDSLAASVLRGGGVKVGSIAAWHANDNVLGDPRALAMLKTLFENSKPFDETNVNSFVTPVVIDGEWILQNSGIDIKFEGYNNEYEHKKPFPVDQRSPCSQWCFPDADVQILFYKTKKELEKEEPDLMSRDDSIYEKDVISNRKLLGLPGMVFMGGRNESQKHRFMNAVKNGVPTVILNDTGGLANVFAALVKTLKGVFELKPDSLSRISTGQEGTADSTAQGAAGVMGAATVQNMLARINPTLLYQHALKEACVGEDSFTSGKVNVADVMELVDCAKGRPQVFTETIQVAEPLLHSPELCLEQLSSCFSSTYTGAVELGASKAQTDVVLAAWRLHAAMEKKIVSLGRRAEILVYAAASLAWVAILFAVILTEFQTCEEVAEEVDDISRKCVVMFLPEFHRYKVHTERCLQVLIVVLPLIAGVIRTLASQCQYHEKWMSLKLASASIVQHIYLFRARCGEYNLARVTSAAFEEGASGSGSGPQEEISDVVKPKVSRMRFVRNVNMVAADVFGFSLQDDFLQEADEENAAGLTENSLPEHISSSLYGHQISKRRSGCCGCCPSRSGSSEERNPLLPQDVAFDDGLTAITAETYFNTRFQMFSSKLRKEAPNLAWSNGAVDILSLGCGFAASMLGAFKISTWIPVVIGLAAMITAIATFLGLKAQLRATNQALAVTHGLEMQYACFSNVDRRTPKFRELIVVKTEQCALNVVQTSVGSSARMSQAGDQDGTEPMDEGREVGKEKAKAS